jgi:Arc/MetJ-type ribon-helix-helix transcriptional regulator
VLVQTKVQIEKESYEFIKKAWKLLHYRSMSDYVREAISAKVREDRRRLRELKREAAFESIGAGPYEDLFASLGGEAFEDR